MTFAEKMGYSVGIGAKSLIESLAALRSMGAQLRCPKYRIFCAKFIQSIQGRVERKPKGLLVPMHQSANLSTWPFLFLGGTKEYSFKSIGENHV